MFYLFHNMEAINLDDLGNDNDSIKLNITSDLPSVNFGSGIELLMNDKAKNNESKNELNIDNLDNIASELDDLSSGFDNNKFVKSDVFKVSFDDKQENNVGQATADLNNNSNKTWDGFDTFNNVPINFEKEKSSEPKLTKEELLREKFKFLRKLEDLEKKGVVLTKHYDMESSLTEMQGEYETIVSEKEKSNSVKFQGRCLTALITGIEFLNGKFDPFDVKLDGWSEQINENIDDYDEIFAELHEKYKSKATMAPELKLVFQLGASAVMLHMTNTMFKSAMPGMDDIMRQNPDLAEQFTKAAVDSMGASNPGFSGFMNNMMNTGDEFNDNINIDVPQSRPDISMSRSSNDGISMNQNSSSKREEMRGPSDISDLLNNLKQKTNINIDDDDNESTISIQDIKDISNKKMPVKTNSRRRKSDKNTISLDI